MLRLFKFLTTKEWLFVLLTAGCVVVSVWLDLKLPSYMTEITEKLYAGAVWQDLIAPGGMMLLCAVCSGVASVIATLFVAQVAGGFGARLRANVYKKVLGFSQNEINKFSTSSLITRTTNDITQVQTLVAFGLVVLVRAPVTAIWALSIILTKSWQWTALVGGAVLMLVIAVTVLIIVVLPRYRKVQKLTDNLNRAARENINGMRVVRAFNAADYQEKKFDKANTDITNNEMFINKSMALMYPFMMMLANGLSLGIYWLGAFIIKDATTIVEKASLFGDMVVFMSYAMQLVISFIMLIVVFIMLPRALVASRRINEVLNTNSSIVSGSQNVNTQQSGTLQFIANSC